jgi:MSHA pilin protein MshC
MSNENHIQINAQLAAKAYVCLKGRTNKGFTIIELVLVIVLLGVLSVTVVPKLFGSNGFEEYVYQAEVIATLRSIQLRAMQQTSIGSNECHTVIITSNLLTVDDNCVANSENSVGDALSKLSVEIETNHSVTFSPDMSFSFDDMGRPLSCSDECIITLVGNDNIRVTIESEGFIHAE